jgi:hypothetical protein
MLFGNKNACPACLDYPKSQGRCSDCFGTGQNTHLNDSSPVCRSCKGTGECTACHGTGRLGGGPPGLVDRIKGRLRGEP